MPRVGKTRKGKTKTGDMSSKGDVSLTGVVKQSEIAHELLRSHNLVQIISQLQAVHNSGLLFAEINQQRIRQGMQELDAESYHQTLGAYIEFLAANADIFSQISAEVMDDEDATHAAKRHKLDQDKANEFEDLSKGNCLRMLTLHERYIAHWFENLYNYMHLLEEKAEKLDMIWREFVKFLEYMHQEEESIIVEHDKHIHDDEELVEKQLNLLERIHQLQAELEEDDDDGGGDGLAPSPEGPEDLASADGDEEGGSGGGPDVGDAEQTAELAAKLESVSQEFSELGQSADGLASGLDDANAPSDDDLMQQQQADIEAEQQHEKDDAQAEEEHELQAKEEAQHSHHKPGI